MVSRRRASIALGLAGLAVPAVLAGCASSAGVQPVTARLHDVRLAHSPTAAALGFDRALQLDRDSPFDCTPNSYGFYSYLGGPFHTESARTVRRGSRWIVTITYDHDSSLRMRYRVRRNSAGYCVDRVLDRIRPADRGPSSPGSGNHDFPPSAPPSMSPS